jgi:hypothetical protein
MGTGRAQLTAAVRAAVGHEPAAVERLPGGSKKGTYRATLADGGTVVVHVWSAEENYWPERDEPDDVFADASGLDLLRAAHDALAAIGVRSPRLLWADDAAQVAVVEDVRGGSLEGRPPPPELREALTAMTGALQTRIGKVARPDRSGRTCPRIILDAAHRDLREAARRVPALAAARERLADRLEERAGAIGPRAEHGLVHGELGPDHVLLDDDGRPVLVDIEGLAWFDAEWEHAFLEMRFGDAYPALRVPGLDPARLHLYRLARSLSLIAGPLRLLDGDYPDREFMLSIAEHHTRTVLAAQWATGPTS